MKKSRFTESRIASILKDADAGLKVAEISTMSQLAQWTVESEKVLVF